VALGVTADGERDILGLWAGEHGDGEGAKYWLRVLTEIRNRGTRDVLMVVCDGLKGFPEAIAQVWPQAVTQTCIVHLLRNSFRYASRRDWAAIAKDLKPVYTAATGAEALERFADFAGTWEARYPAIIRLWENAWEEFIPFLDYGACRELVFPGGRWTVVSAGRWRWPAAGQMRAARWILSRLKAAAARWSSLAAASKPRRENRSMIFFRLPIPGSTVAPRRL
jgi:hypothetical protein